MSETEAMTGAEADQTEASEVVDPAAAATDEAGAVETVEADEPDRRGRPMSPRPMSPRPMSRADDRTDRPARRMTTPLRRRGREDAGEETSTTLQERLENEGDIAADYLEELLDIADLDGDLDMDVEGERALVSIVGADLAQLVGERGEVLEALQELTRLAVYRETGDRSRLMLDVSRPPGRGTSPARGRWPRRPRPR